jgi:hypothetical protein
MLDVLDDEEVFWHQQCYNPHARQWTYQCVLHYRNTVVFQEK